MIESESNPAKHTVFRERLSEYFCPALNISNFLWSQTHQLCLC